MSDHNLIDDPLVSFDSQEQSTAIKSKSNELVENRLLDDIDPFGNLSGQENHHNGTNTNNKNNNFDPFSLSNDLFPEAPNENKTAIHEFSMDTDEKTEDSSLNIQSKLNGSVADKNSLLLELDSEAPLPPSHFTDPSNIETSSPNDPFKQLTNISSEQDQKSEFLVTFEDSTNNSAQQGQDSNLTSFSNPMFDIAKNEANKNLVLSSPSNEYEEQLLLRQASEELDIAAHELEAKIDLITSPPPSAEQSPLVLTESTMEEKQSVTSPKSESTIPKASPTKKTTTSATRPASGAKTKPSSVTTTTSKSIEHKPAAAAAAAAASKNREHRAVTSTVNATEPKPSVTTRKTMHSGPATNVATANKTKITPTSPIQESTTTTKSTASVATKPHSATTKPRPAATQSPNKPVTKPTRPSTVPKTSVPTSPSDKQTTTLSTAPASSTSSTTNRTTSTTKTSTRTPLSSARTPTKAVSSTATAGSSHVTSSTTASASRTTITKQRPISHNRATASRPATATSASTTVTSKRSNSANRPSTADARSRPVRPSAAESASGTTASSTTAKPQWNSATSKVGSLQNAAHKAGGGTFKIPNQKLQWNARSKVGSLENARHKPGGGTVKIESKKLDFKDKTKAKIDCGKHETITPEHVDDNVNASATVNEEQHENDETSDEILESQTNDNGDN